MGVHKPATVVDCWALHAWSLLLLLQHSTPCVVRNPDCAPVVVYLCSSRVLSSSGQLGVPKVDKPHVTEPKPFNLRSDSRARVRRSHEQPTMQQAAAAGGGGHFRAQPLNRSILDGPVSATGLAC